IGYFVSKQESPFYESQSFTNILEFIKKNPTTGKMYEKDETLRISFTDVTQLIQAHRILSALKTGSKLS
ncbi:MAG: hypothetical protein ACKO8Q_01045, partial [Bacteroidota bacterium]